jgi:aryl-alcohol dehydrogenase-like predicted oxidoreductase
MYSLVRRQVEVEILPLAKAAGLGVIPYSPLGGGLLTGKYQAGQGGAAADGASHRTGTGRLTSNERYAARYGFASDDAAAAGLVGVAREMGVQPAALAVAWVMANPAVTAPIIGARNVGQLEGSLGALDVAMTPDLYARLCALTPTPHPATDRTELINGVSDQL